MRVPKSGSEKWERKVGQVRDKYKYDYFLLESEAQLADSE